MDSFTTFSAIYIKCFVHEEFLKRMALLLGIFLSTVAGTRHGTSPLNEYNQLLPDEKSHSIIFFVEDEAINYLCCELLKIKILFLNIINLNLLCMMPKQQKNFKYLKLPSPLNDTSLSA